MPLHIAKEKKILNTLKKLPMEKLEEVLDFAKHLKTKERKAVKPKKAKRIKLPAFHMGNVEKTVFGRSNLYGEYLDRKLA